MVAVVQRVGMRLDNCKGQESLGQVLPMQVETETALVGRPDLIQCRCHSLVVVQSMTVMLAWQALRNSD